MKTQCRLLALVAAVTLLPGCAYTSAQLEIEPHSTTRVAGPLKDIGLVAFRATQLEDARQDQARIGYKRNGFGQNTADITTSEPVDQIVAKTIDKAIVDSGHALGDDGVLQIVGTVDRFWFDTDVNFWTITFIGEVACTLDFIDALTKQSVHKSKYVGSYSVDKAGGLEKTWTAVMAMALDKLIEDITLDEDMADALRAHVAAKGNTKTP
jgi:uncharacterized lipoprotein YajG